LKDLIDLQNSHVTQVTQGGTRSEWKVRKNITSEDLFSLPGNLSEKDVFTVLEFARKYEQIAFQAGVVFQKKASDTMHKEQIDRLIIINKRATEENERLANKLGELIGKKE
jgi:hypothetical protein